MRIFYLHGFASSPQSTKRAFLADRLRQHGLMLHAPDFNEPDFSTLTMSRMLGQTTTAVDEVADDRVILIGSSLGGFVAVQTALARPGRVDRMVLLAPALDFTANRLRELGDRGLDAWRTSGALNVFHYGFGRMIPVHYELYTDARQYECTSATLDMPILIVQGTRDTAVNPVAVERWSASRPNVELHLLDDDHQLTASLETIWQRMKGFLGLETPERPA